MALNVCEIEYISNFTLTGSEYSILNKFCVFILHYDAAFFYILYEQSI